MNSDFKDLLRTFAEEQVEYLIVGAYAVIHYTQPRYTKDIDIWIRPSMENAARVAKAFQKFGIPLIEVTQQDFELEGLQYVIGVSPCQIDFLTSLPGAPSFEAAWQNRSTGYEDGIPIEFLGKDELIATKRTASRMQDLADIEEIARFDSYS